MDLKEFSVFKGIPEEQLSELLKHINLRKFARKTQIITEGDDSHCVYFVTEGRVKVYLDDESGKEIIINIHGPGEFFGELGLIQNTTRTASVVTLEDATLGLLSSADFRNCLRRYPDFALQIIHNLAGRLEHATEAIRQLGLMDVYGRIVVTFLNLSDEQDGKRVIRERLTQKDIASRVGASREMVARIMKDLRVGEYIDIVDGHIVIQKSLPHSW